MRTILKRADALFFFMGGLFRLGGIIAWLMAITVLPPILHASPAAPRADQNDVSGGVATGGSRLPLAKGVTDYALADAFIIPGTIMAERNGSVLREGEEYRVSCPEGMLHLLFEPEDAETLEVSYRHYELMIPAVYKASISMLDGRERNHVASDIQAVSHLRAGRAARMPSSRLFSIKGSKGFSVGQGRGGELSMDQSLDLSVNGHLPGGTHVELRLSDQSIPVTGAGTSVELRELDRVSFRVFNGPASATLGDYRYSIDGFEFAGIERKLEGVRGDLVGENFSVAGAAAVKPGKFASRDFTGIEGKQGPYVLFAGDEVGGESAFVLAGTERVYLDGLLMKRGDGKDYTIDYNSSTITFTSRRLIGSDSRIEVDYEYSRVGERGTLYSSTFSVDPVGSPVEVRGYYLGEADAGSSVGKAVESGRDDRFGLALEYAPGLGFQMEGEGAYQLENSRGADPTINGGHSGAFWLKGGLADVSLFDRDGKKDKWRLSWYEKGVQKGFSFPGRNHKPDFRWSWGLSPAENTREEWRQLEFGTLLMDDIDLALEWGKIRRDNGEYALKRRVKGEFRNEAGVPYVEGELFSIHSNRGGSESSGGALEQVDITGRALTLSGRWVGWTPSIKYLFREEVENSSPGRGTGYDEISPAIGGLIAGRVETNLAFRVRAERVMTPDLVGWVDDARLLQGRAEVELGSPSSIRVRGATEYRRKRYLRGFGGDVTTVLGRGEFLTAGWDRSYSTSTIYELTSTSNVVNRAVFIPEKEDEGEYLADGTYVGPGRGTHVRQSVPSMEGEGQVLGASLNSTQDLDLSSLVEGRGWPLVSLTHTSTISLKQERIGDDRWRVYLFFPEGPGGGSTGLYRNMQYRGELEGTWGEEAGWTTSLDYEYMDLEDARYENISQDMNQRLAQFTVGGAGGDGFDLEINLIAKNRADRNSYGVSTDLREKRVESEFGYAPGSQARCFVALDGGVSRDRLSDIRLNDRSIGPGIDLFFGGGGNLDLQYRLENVSDGSDGRPLPVVMLAGRSTGTTHHYQLRANCRLKGALDFAASLTGMKRPGGETFENSGRMDLTYRF